MTELALNKPVVIIAGPEKMRCIGVPQTVDVVARGQGSNKEDLLEILLQGPPRDPPTLLIRYQRRIPSYGVSKVGLNA